MKLLRPLAAGVCPIHIAGQLDAGAFIYDDDCNAQLSCALGTPLLQAGVSADGRFTLCGSLLYRGAAEIRISIGQQLVLRSALLIDHQRHYQINVNPLTELLVRKLEPGRRLRSLSPARLQRLNRALARTFGLNCLLSDEVIPPTARDGRSQLQQANCYGQMLAAIAALGWMQQESLDQILDQLHRSLDSEAKLSADARVALLLAAAETGAAATCCIAKALGITEFAELITPEQASGHTSPAPSLGQLQKLGHTGLLHEAPSRPIPLRRA